MVIFSLLDIVVPIMLFGEVYTKAATAPFCNKSDEAQASPCCLCPLNTPCDLPCPGEWKRIRGNNVTCQHLNAPTDNVTSDNVDEALNYTDDYLNNYADYINSLYDADQLPIIAEGERALTSNGTSSLDHPPVPDNTSTMYCVEDCPSGTFYEHRHFRCQPCDLSCKACVGPGSIDCTECKFEINDGCIEECPPGWEPISGFKGSRRGTVCRIRVADDRWSSTVVIVGSVGGAVLGAVGVGVLIFCLCKRRGRSKTLAVATKKTAQAGNVRRENYLDAGCTDENKPLQSENTDDTSYHEYNEIDDKKIEDKYEYTYIENEGTAQQHTEPEEGYEPINGDFEDTNHDIHAEENIYEEMNLPNPCKRPTPRARQEPYLTPVADNAEINKDKKVPDLTPVADNTNSDKDKKLSDESNGNVVDSSVVVRLNAGDNDDVEATLSEEYLVPISKTPKDVPSERETNSNINSNQNISQVATDTTVSGDGIHDSTVVDGTEGEVYQNIAGEEERTKVLVSSGTESDSEKPLHFPRMGVKQASNENDKKRGNSKTNERPGEKPKIKPKPLPKPKIHKLQTQPRVDSATRVEPSSNPVTEPVPDSNLEITVPLQPRHFKPLPIPRKPKTSGNVNVQGESAVTTSGTDQDKKAELAKVPESKENDRKPAKGDACKADFPDTPDAALDVPKDAVKRTSQYTDVISAEDFKDTTEDHVYEESSPVNNAADLSLPKRDSPLITEEEMKRLFYPTTK